MSKSSVAELGIPWDRFERDVLRRERPRLIRKGTIVPAFRMKPQMLVKDAEGNWKPEIKVIRHA